MPFRTSPLTVERRINWKWVRTANHHSQLSGKEVVRPLPAFSNPVLGRPDLPTATARSEAQGGRPRAPATAPMLTGSGSEEKLASCASPAPGTPPCGPRRLAEVPEAEVAKRRGGAGLWEGVRLSSRFLSSRRRRGPSR